jgi:hypothetical protein
MYNTTIPTYLCYYLPCVTVLFLFVIIVWKHSVQVNKMFSFFLSKLTLYTYITSRMFLAEVGSDSFHLLRSLHTPFAFSTFIKFLIHARRFRTLLTWPFSKTCPIWLRNVRLGLPSSIGTLNRFINLFCQPPFIHPYMTKQFQYILLNFSHYITPHSSLITSFLTLSLTSWL